MGTDKLLLFGGTGKRLWCADFKGEFKLGNGQHCCPLTVTDHASRYLPMCETREDTAITAFEQLFLERGLPDAIRCDNVVPFASPNALFNPSKLSVWCYGWALRSNASDLASRSRTAVMSPCI